MKISGVDIRPGNIIEYEGGIWRAVKIQHTQPGKGGAYMQVEMKNLIDGRKTNVRFRSAETVERVRLDTKDFQFLFADGDMLTFMDKDSYEQISLPRDLLGDAAAFLQDGMDVVMELHDERPISVQLPDTIEATIVEADAVVKGQTASSSYKPAMLDNGVRVMVPPHISAGTQDRRRRLRTDLREARRLMVSHSGLITVMTRAVRKAAPRLRRDYNEVEQLQVSKKGPADFVSMADKRAETTLVEELRNARPDWGMLLEEGGAIEGNPSKPRWIVDPLDGTTNFLHGVPHFSISIAVEEPLPGGKTGISHGLVYQPLTDETFWAEKGRGAWLNDRRLRVSARRNLTEALIGTGIPHFGRGDVAALVAHLRRDRARSMRDPPVGIGRTRSRLGRGGPVRRFLGRRSRHLGYGRRRAAGQGSGRIRQRLSRPGSDVRSARISGGERRTSQPAAQAACWSAPLTLFANHSHCFRCLPR